MTSFDNRLNPRYPIKECSSCGALYTTDYCCSNGSLVDTIICDLNKAPNSPHLLTFLSNQRHCFHCKDVLGDGEFCQRCTCTRCGSGLSKGLCLICKHNQNSLNDYPSNFANSSQSPPHINHHCCYECGDPLEEFQEFHDFQQQDLCCENCGVTHEAYQFQPKIKDYYHEQNFGYDSNSFGFDQFQPHQFTVNHHVFNVQNDLFDSQNKLMEQLTSTYDMTPTCYDDYDDDYAFAITPNKPDYSLSIGDEHPDTVPATKSDKFIKSSVENLVPIPSESEGESEYDVPVREEFTTFSNILFDADYESDSSDDQSFSDKDVPEKIFLTPLFDEEIIPMKMDQHHYNAESDLIESLRIHDSSLIISSKIDSLLDEFADELALLKSIPPKIDETDCDFEEDIRLIEKFFDSLMEETDLSFTLDYPMPPGIEDDDYDSERDILILKDLPSNDSLSLPKKESFHFDIPSFSRPPAKPPDGNIGILDVKMMGDISDQKVHMPKLMITLASHHEKSPNLSSHRGLKTFQPSAKCPMMIHGKNIPILDVPLFHFYPP
nr:hypothetical protein [Tanacetum cinerariifolium]